MTVPAKEMATIGGGCYWCLEAVFELLRGVESVVSGFSGGHVDNPTYRQVCQENTGHAEVIQIQFDPSVISFRELLNVFFATHDPTTRNRQGNDVGPQYRSAVFFHSLEQEQTAREVIAKIDAQQIWPKPIVTEVAPFRAFYAAEDYHQGYFRNNGTQPYCAYVVAPKVAKFRKEYVDRLKQ
jgi:peptide-methionine (S)-S-oxide reductase